MNQDEGDVYTGPFNPNLEITEFNKRWAVQKSAAGEINQIEMHHILGEGSFGKVILIRHRAKNQFFAMKVLDKEQIVRTDQVAHSIMEKKILYALKFQFCVRLHTHFQDNASLYLVLDLAAGGDLYDVFMKFKKFNEQMSKFYSSQIFLALEYMHLMDIMHRDLKPENVLVNADGYLKLTDFGFAKRTTARAWTFCGTPEYIAPEVIQNKSYNLSVDWWSWGVMVYEMVNGYTPFRGRNHLEIFEKICSGNILAPNFFSDPLKHLVLNVIQRDLTKRFGNLRARSDDIKYHEWFKDCNFEQIYAKKIVPPYKPEIKKPKNARPPILNQVGINRYGAVFNDF